MSSQTPSSPHFVLIPLMASGHQIPMVEMGKLLSQRGVTVTIVTTPLNALGLDPIITAHSADPGLEIRLLPIRFPCTEAGLPEGMMRGPLEKILWEIQLPPTCIISDKHLPWTVQITSKLQILKILFDGTSCFIFVCSRNISTSKVYDQGSDLETFMVPAQLPSPFNCGPIGLGDLREEIVEAEKASYGWAYVQEYRKTKGNKVWCVGPVSLCNTGDSDKAHRGNKSTINEGRCLKWLDSWSPSSVIYTCLGTLNYLTAPQLIELGSGLEAMGRPFIWFHMWVLELEGRIQDRGLLIWGWAPQMRILSHPSGFVPAGMWMVVWPLFAEQFYNERFIVMVLGIGVSVGARAAIRCGGEGKAEGLVKREDVRKSVEEVMSRGREGEEMRKRALRLAEKAKRAIGGEGSSYLEIKAFVEDVKQISNKLKQEVKDL
ncbi:hypothetical protein ACJRO7_001299 [Eucalyptus globulus]|uniref:Uncharacterized protein n=1 Tax=Eucalyptus globulus TaxID=34317 RepID=A0ABD3LRG5_EUCGL